MSGLREKILAAKDDKEQELEIPEWDVKVLVTTMSGTARAEWIRDCVKKDRTMDIPKAFPQLVIRCAVDPETREAIFTQADRDALMLKNGKAVERIAQVALELNGLTEIAQKEMAENLGQEPNGGSSST